MARSRLSAKTGKLTSKLFGFGFIIVTAILFLLVYTTTTWPASPTRDFLNARGVGSLLFVHKALWTGGGIRISVIKQRGRDETIQCYLWYSSKQTSNATRVPAVVKDLVSYNIRLTIAYIKCPLNNTEMEKVAPVAVGLANKDSLSTEDIVWLSVENRGMDPNLIQKHAHESFTRSKQNQPHQHRIVEFTVCIPPMFLYDDATQLVEKLEMIKFLGAGRVVLYDHSIASNVNSTLQFYMNEWAEGRDALEVIVHSWKTPDIKIHYKGQVAAIDDCLYRYGWLSQYMVFNDLDEFMIPLRHDNWSSLIAEREKLNPGQAAFMFRSSYMDKDHTSVQKGFEGDAFRYGSSILSFTQRDKSIWPSHHKSKLIVNPRKVESLAVHEVFEANASTDVIPEDQGILYHYRWPIEDCQPEVKDTRVVDKYGKKLLARIKEVWSKLDGVCMGSGQYNIDSGTYNCHPINLGVAINGAFVRVLILAQVIQLIKNTLFT